MVPGLWWAWQFTGVGAVALVVVEAAILALGVVATPPGRATYLMLPASLLLASALRAHLPLGGLPIADLAQGQVAGPLLELARLGGPLLVVAATAGLGTALAAVLQRELRLRGLAAVALIAVAVLLAWAAPDGGRPSRSLPVASVQGGGLRGFTALEVDPASVLRAHLDALASLKATQVRGGLVLLPENAAALDLPLRGSVLADELSAEARRLHATVAIGYTLTLPEDRYRNALAVFAPSGRYLGDVVKRHRVPFGEYVPMRGLLSHFANLEAVPRDATIGSGDGTIATPAGKLGVAISYEVFYAHQVDGSVRDGAQLLVVPTNTASYPTAQVPTMELAAARLDAVASGRDLAQAAPTGYSALIDHRGRVLERSALGGREVLVRELSLRNGETVATWLGPWPIVVVALLGLSLSWWRRGRRYS